MLIKKLLYVVILTGFFLTFSFGKNCFAEDLIKVMTFNLRYGTAPDGPNHWNNRKDILINAIKKYSPDLIGTQECLDFQAKYIVESLPEYNWVGRGREKDDEGERVAVFYKKDRWELLEEKYFWISETPEVPGSKSWDSACPRIVTFLKLKDKSSNGSIYFVNVHLDHKGNVARMKGAEMIVERLKNVEQNVPVIITGDFNTPAEESEPWKLFISNGYKDAWCEAKEKGGPISTWCGFKGPDYSSTNRIDWILYKGNFTTKKCETVIYNEDGRYPSDHFPVFAILTK